MNESPPTKHPGAVPGSVLPFLVILFLAACGALKTEYQGSCTQQTQQFMDTMHSLEINELNPLIEDGFHSGPTADVMTRLEELNKRINEADAPECNPRAKAVKDAFLLYMLEVKNYFSTVTGRAVYGEGAIQAQRAKMSEAGQAFEIALEDMRK